jgi:hypothetical protein
VGFLLGVARNNKVKTHSAVLVDLEADETKPSHRLEVNSSNVVVAHVREKHYQAKITCGGGTRQPEWRKNGK